MTQAPPAAPAEDRQRPAASEDAHRTLRHVGLVMVTRALHLGGATLYATVVPRLMGPALFGNYTLLTSIAGWFANMTGMGAVSMVSRRIPAFLAAGDRAGADKLITNLLVLRSGVSLLAALGYLVIVGAVLGEPDGLAALLVALAVPARILSGLCFGVFIGQGQVVRWTVGELLLRYLTLTGVIAGSLAGGLRGACAGFLVASLVLLLISLAGLGGVVRWSSLDLSRQYLSSYLRPGTAFAISHVVHLLATRSGAVVVRLASGSYVQIGYFGAALAVYLTGAQAVWQLATSFLPLLVSRFHAGDLRMVGRWLERMLSLLVISTVLFNFAVLFVGVELVPLVLGEAYAPVTTVLVPMSLSLAALAFAATGRTLALVLDRPRVMAWAAVVELAVAWTVGLALARTLAATGAALGLLLGTVVWAVALWWPVRQELPFSPLPGLKALGLGAAFAPVLLLRGGWALNALLCAACAAAYLALVVRLHVVAPKDLQMLRDMLRRRRAAPDPALTLDQ